MRHQVRQPGSTTPSNVGPDHAVLRPYGGGGLGLVDRADAASEATTKGPSRRCGGFHGLGLLVAVVDIQEHAVGGVLAAVDDELGGRGGATGGVTGRSDLSRILLFLAQDLQRASHTGTLAGTVTGNEIWQCRGESELSETRR